MKEKRLTHSIIHGLFAASVFAMTASFATGAPVFSQTKATITAADGSDRDSFSRLGIQSADDITLTSPATIRSVTWWGVFGFNNSPVPPASFDLIFYADSSGVPNASAVISSTSVAFNTLTDTGKKLSSGLKIYEFKADISPTALPAGVKVWFSVLADTINDSNDNFLWAHDSASGIYAFRGPIATDPWDTFTGRNLFILDDAPLVVPVLRIDAFSRVSGDLFEVSLCGSPNTPYHFKLTPNMDFPTGTIVEGLSQGSASEPGTISGLNNQIITTNSGGEATVRVILQGPAQFIRAESIE